MTPTPSPLQEEKKEGKRVSARHMVDVCCGTRFGWTKGFIAHGWDCTGIDIVDVPDYPGRFIRADIAHLIELPEADFYCCSTPCEQFSVHGLRCFFPNPKWPLIGFALFEHARRLLEATSKPYVMENVRAAQPFIGESSLNCGPFYMWGNCIPALIPAELAYLRKGRRLKKGGYKTQTKQRNDISAARIVSEIPFLLASYIAQTAGAL